MLKTLSLVVIVGILSLGLEGCMYRILWHDASKEKIRVVGNAPELYVVRVDTSYSIHMACNSLIVSRTTKCLRMDGSSLPFQPIATFEAFCRVHSVFVICTLRKTHTPKSSLRNTLPVCYYRSFTVSPSRRWYL
jgi:hypothetical protein